MIQVTAKALVSAKRALLFIYVAAFALAVFLASLETGITHYYSSAYTFTNSSSLPKVLQVEATSMFNGYSEVVQLQPNQSLDSLRLHSSALDLASIQNSELTAALLYLAILSIALFDYFSKELGYSRLYKFMGAGAVALFASFFISILASQYVTACYYFCSGGSLSGLSGFQVDSAAAAVIFASFAISSLIGAYQLKVIRLPVLVAALLLCSIVISFALGTLSADLGFTQAGALPQSSYAVHSFDLFTFYSFFIITYLTFNYLAMRNQG